MRIFTLTLNPAYDIHACCDEFMAFSEVHATVTARQAGGKGYNISRALNSNGTPNTAIVVVGEENCDDFVKMSKELNCIFFKEKGRIRENITLHSNGGKETRISFTGAEVSSGILQKIYNVIKPDENTIVTFTGSIPKGITKEQAKEFLCLIKKDGAKIVVDTKSFNLADIYEVSPWLVKPNQDELGTYFGEKITTKEKATQKATEMKNHGIENVIVSLGENGAVLCAENEIIEAITPPIQVVSTIGAGDSMIAGFISAKSSNLTTEECFKTAVSYGSAACLSKGSLPPQPNSIIEIKKLVMTTKKTI